MKRILIVGSGDVAMRVMPLLLQRYKVYALVRNPAYCLKLRAIGVVPILGDLDELASLSGIAGLADTILHLAPPPNVGVRDIRTRNLLSALARPNGVRGNKKITPKKLVYVSTSGVYGDCQGASVNETRPLGAISPRALRRVDAEASVRAWARRNQVCASILRVPGIYASDRLPVSRLKQGAPAIIASEDSYTNHINADDLARICLAALLHGKSCRVYHSSDDSNLKMGEYFDCVADALGLPRVPRISREQAQSVLSPMMLSFMNESRRLSNQRMKRELKVKLRYPTVADTLAAIKLSRVTASH